MYEVLAKYYALLYIVFAKGPLKLGKGISLIVSKEFEEPSLIKHFMKVFGVSYLSEIRRKVYEFLEENVEKLSSSR